MDICTISHTAKQAISALLKHLKQRSDVWHQTGKNRNRDKILFVLLSI